MLDSLFSNPSFSAGVGMIFKTVDSPTIVSEFNDVFERDWTSPYATILQ
jgi:hypothetical protein